MLDHGHVTGNKVWMINHELTKQVKPKFIGMKSPDENNLQQNLIEEIFGQRGLPIWGNSAARGPEGRKSDFGALRIRA